MRTPCACWYAAICWRYHSPNPTPSCAVRSGGLLQQLGGAMDEPQVCWSDADRVSEDEAQAAGPSVCACGSAASTAAAMSYVDCRISSYVVPIGCTSRCVENQMSGSLSRL